MHVSIIPESTLIKSPDILIISHNGKGLYGSPSVIMYKPCGSCDVGVGPGVARAAQERGGLNRCDGNTRKQPRIRIQFLRLSAEVCLALRVIETTYGTQRIVAGPQPFEPLRPTCKAKARDTPQTCERVYKQFF